MKHVRLVFVCLALLLSLALFCSCTNTEKLWKDALYTEDTTLGEGSFTFTLTVTAGDKSVVFTISTNTVYLGQALLDLGLIEGEASTYGIYIEKVNGIKADYSKNGAWWGVYVNGEAAQSGVDFIAITNGASYTLSYER
ncbi:MAG: DUF4430 domain-containing protein [Clostridia bacterium]|nr:DUF4430 domain-containing protein [Clostridia bacterium]